MPKGGSSEGGPKRGTGKAAKEAAASAAPGGGGADVSAGGFADRRKYRLEEETAAYFKEIAGVLKTTEDAEQRQLLISNALGESLGGIISL